MALLPVLVLWLTVWIILLNGTTTEIANAAQSVAYAVYTDQESGGYSTATVTEGAGGLIFRYTLKKGYAYPYAGVSFRPDSGMFVFNPNSIFTIELSMQVAGVIPVILNEYLKDAAGKTHIRPVQYELKTTAGTHAYCIPWKAFNVPLWWYKNNGFSEADLPECNPANIKNVCIQNTSLSVFDKEEGFIIKEMRNRDDKNAWIWIAGIFSCAWFSGYGIFFMLKKKKVPVFIPYVSTSTEEKSFDEWTRIRQYISTNYMNDIDMEGMEKALGIARHKISLLIKENTTLIFKQYLNQIKVAEAKRLLQETDLPVGEIADQVGFGHLSNFNRVFKQYTGESPSDLRKQVNN